MTGHDLDLREWFTSGCWVGAPIPIADAALAAAEQDEPGCLGDCGWKHCRPPCPHAGQGEPTLPANWFERDGLTDDGSRFAYCDAEGSERARAEQPEPTPEQP